VLASNGMVGLADRFQIAFVLGLLARFRIAPA
jgi:hypothetical protein